MPGYDTHTRTLRLGGLDYRIRSLADLQQFADPDNHAQLLGISSAQWSLFGHVWPAGRLLAEAMATHDVAGKRILALGCGLGLPSLVLRRRGADVVAREYNPLAATSPASTSPPHTRLAVLLCTPRVAPQNARKRAV